MVKEKILCPICGFDELEHQPWSGDSPSDEICSCCDMHFGYYDFAPKSQRDEIYKEWRENWIKDGMKFSFEE